jgi:glycogen debranching enzyme
VLDGPDGADARVRPNQIFAVALTHSPLEKDQQLAVVDTCQRKLLTRCGLRSLAPDELGYRGRYEGDLVQRDEAYHQGTVWGWLLGPFVVAHYRVHHDAAQAAAFLAPIFGQLWTATVGTLSEVFDGDEPHHPDGCFAQAWSVAETLRAWCLTQDASRAAQP